MFVNRFVLLHPTRVTAASVGAPGGWPMLQIRCWRGVRLRFPVGVGDLRSIAGVEFDSTALRQVPIRFFLGAKDESDSVPYGDAYDAPERAQVQRFFGRTPVARWAHAEAVWRRHAPRSEWRLYDGIGHEVTPAMWDDIWRFLSRHAAP